jgi:hypothetical protein
MFAASAVSVQDAADGTPNNAPTDRAIAEERRPTVTWTDTVTRNPWAGGTERMVQLSPVYLRELSSRKPLKPAPDTRDGCQFIRAVLIYSNGLNGGWCWLITTACSQYLQGDCWGWYTSAIPPEKSAFGK